MTAKSPVIYSRRTRGTLRWLMIAGFTMAAVILGSEWITQRPGRELRSAGALLAEAYSKQRVFELRLPDASYTAVERQPIAEASSFSRPIALLEAESRIALHLGKNPDDAQWLRLRARAEMLDRHYDDAVSTLKRATDAQPDDVSLLADLGCAYALRAEGEKRDIDYGAAIDMLWRFLRAKPDSPVALFNRAVVYERMFLYDDARKDWEHYLKLDSSSGWATEASRAQAGDRREDGGAGTGHEEPGERGWISGVREKRAGFRPGVLSGIGCEGVAAGGRLGFGDQ